MEEGGEAVAAARTIEVVELVRPARGGMRTHVLSLASRLDRGRFRPVLAGDLGLSAEERARLLALGVEVVDVGIPLGPGPALLRAVAAIRRILAHRPAAILHCHGLAAGLVGRLAARDGRPVVVTAHNLPARAGLAGVLEGELERRLARRTARYIAVSQAVGEGLRALGVPGEAVAVIPPGVDTRRYRPPTPEERSLARRRLGLPEDGPVVGFLGRLARDKGPDLLLEALARLSGRPTVALAGEGPMEGELRARAAALGLSGALRFLGRLADPLPFHWAIDVLAAPSRREGLGLAALEALACGRPVAGFRAGGLVEAVASGRDGLLVPAGDTARLAEALLHLCQDEVLRRRFAAEGRRRVTASFSLDATVRKIGELYAELAGFGWGPGGRARGPAPAWRGPGGRGAGRD